MNRPAFASRSAFVSGAASGIGRATATAFAQQGALVLACDLGAERLAALVGEIEGAGGRARAVESDVTDRDALGAALERAMDGAPPLAAAFNAAGVEGPLAPTEEISAGDWDRTLAVNVTGMWNCMRLQLPFLRAAGGGAIVNCASVFGLVGSRGGSAYAASKHAVVGLTRSAALESAAAGIRVNAVCPGLTDTPMLERLETANPRFRDAALGLSPRRRLIAPEQVAAAVLWLCGPAAEGINGQALPIDDGMTVG